MRSPFPPLAAVLAVPALMLLGCSAESSPDSSTEAETEVEAADGQTDTEGGAQEDDQGFPADPIGTDGLGPCDMLDEEAAGRLGLPATGEPGAELDGRVLECEWGDLLGNYLSIIPDEFGYSGFSLLADAEGLDVTEVGGYPAFELREADVCVVHLALSPDMMIALNAFQDGETDSDCSYAWEAAEEVIATLA